MQAIDRKTFIKLLWRYRRRGSISRRDFLGLSGLGLATAVFAANKSVLAADLGNQVTLATRLNYHDSENFGIFTEQTGVFMKIEVFESDKALFAALRTDGSARDVLVPVNYTIDAYVKRDLIEPLDLSKLPNFVASAYEPRFLAPGTVNGTVYALPKNWGTTGYVVNATRISEKPDTWRAFWDLAMGRASGQVVVLDEQLAAVGNALKYFGYSFNSLEDAELADAERLLLAAKPYLLAVDSEPQAALRSGAAWMAMCRSGMASQLRDVPGMYYVIGKEGGEIWCDYYAISSSAPHREAAYALIDFLLNPEVNAREVKAHGYASADRRANALLPRKVLDDPIMYPAAEQLSALEFAAAATLTDPLRGEIMARFRDA